MVKIGFIVEGGAEEIILKSEKFQDFANSNNLEITGVHDAKGKGNFTTYSKKVNSFVEILKDRLTQYIIIVTDLENDPCITYTKNSVNKYDVNIQLELVSVKAIESWFLADSKTLSKIFETNFHFSNPEETDKLPFDQIKEIFFNLTGRGISKSKNMLAKKMIKNGFSVLNAANHPKCKSAKYFIDKLTELSMQ